MDVDRKFLETASQMFGKHAHFSQTNVAFMIKHYAGETHPFNPISHERTLLLTHDNTIHLFNTRQHHLLSLTYPLDTL